MVDLQEFRKVHLLYRSWRCHRRDANQAIRSLAHSFLVTSSYCPTFAHLMRILINGLILVEKIIGFPSGIPHRLRSRPQSQNLRRNENFKQVVLNCATGTYLFRWIGSHILSEYRFYSALDCSQFVICIRSTSKHER